MSGRSPGALALAILLFGCGKDAAGAPPSSTGPSSASAAPASGSSGKTVAGVVFGESVDAFRESCKAAGKTADGFDWSREPPEVKAWSEQGLASECSGTPQDYDLGNVRQVDAIFREDHLTSVTLYLDLEPEQALAALQQKYGTPGNSEGRPMFLVDRAAEGDAIMSAAIGPPYASGGKCSITYVSRTGVDHPFLGPQSIH